MSQAADIHSGSGASSAPERRTADRTDESNSSRNLAPLSRLLRGAGAAILLASASVFLFQTWNDGNDLMRYAALLGFTALLAGAALACGLGLRESKAARTLLAVALALIPVHAAVLGALVYSRFAIDSTAGVLPPFGVWTAPSDLAALVAPLIGLACLVPVVYLAARALVPPVPGRITGAVLALNLPLLLPFRTPLPTAYLVAALTALVVMFELRWPPRVPALRTFEGGLVRTLLAAPVFLAFARAHLHGTGPPLLASACLSLGGALFALSRRLSSRMASAAALETLALAPLAYGWTILIWDGSVPIPLLPLTLPFAGALALLSRWSSGSGPGYRRLAAGIAASGAIGQLILEPSVAASALCLALGLATLAYGYHVEQRLVLATGVLGAAAGLVYQLKFALELYSWSRWGALAVVGLATIVAAALLERYQARVFAWAGRLTRRVGGWSL